MPSRTNEAPNEWSDSADIVSRFLALQQIYSAKELDTYLQSRQHTEKDASDSESRPVDVVVLCASAILAIPEAVFEWAVQQQNHPETRKRNTVLVLCGGIGPCTPFVYDAVQASKKYCRIFDAINGKPEGQVLKAMAERFYKLRINEAKENEGDGFRILVSDRSTNCGADASDARKVLEGHGIYSPRSMVVVQDPAMSSRTVSAFEVVYNDMDTNISSWPQLKDSQKGKHQAGQKNQRQLWSMDRFLERIMGEQSGLPKNIKTNASIDIPNEVEDAWSTVMDKDSLKASY
ncbi:hypothetical protein F53441_4732 [Fusarium austroafricanum]|uniref:DUF218 domain-containing protein n=1 Tax=Fusarium austroafricanum TaxID=2364996 RepID=A0A8H4KJR0_9HYPO|nr:hypothetical protein F53441_4732 [Fusarium austroafricanum]